MASRSKSGAANIVALAVFVVLLAVLLSWSVINDNVTAGSFHLDEVALCDDLDDSMGPLAKKSVFNGDTKQICLWFEYSRGRDGDQLEVIWRYEKDDIQRESFRLVHARGTRAFYLLMEDGSDLLPGQYSVTIMCNSRRKGTEYFVVEKDPDDGDALSDDDEPVYDD